jgi:hypothetical protein
MRNGWMDREDIKQERQTNKQRCRHTDRERKKKERERDVGRQTDR